MFNVERSGEEVRKLSNNNEKCVGCGICVDTCPTNSLRLGPIVPIARNLVQMEYISINQKNCVLCGLCAISCPFEALNFEINGENIRKLPQYPHWEIDANINQEDCIYCGKCVRACPRDTILFQRKLPDINNFLSGSIEIDKDKCIYCGFCEEICPSEAISLTTTAECINDLVKNDIEVDDSKCVYCGVCKRICPENAIITLCDVCMRSEYMDLPEITGETLIEDAFCINCGWCDEVCPVDATSVVKPFTGEVILNETEETPCKGDSCHACQDVCPCNAISIIDGKNFVDSKVCNLCGACTKACPQGILDINRTSMKLNNIKSDSWKKILGNLLESK